MATATLPTLTTMTEDAARGGVATAAGELAQRRTTLTLLVQGGAPGTDLAQVANDVARLEGQRDVWLTIAAAYNGAASDGEGRDAARRDLVGLLLSDPDDGRSGRGNDARRSYTDGVKEAARHVTRYGAHL